MEGEVGVRRRATRWAFFPPQRCWVTWQSHLLCVKQRSANALLDGYRAWCWKGGGWRGFRWRKADSRHRRPVPTTTTNTTAALADNDDDDEGAAEGEEEGEEEEEKNPAGQERQCPYINNSRVLSSYSQFPTAAALVPPLHLHLRSLH